MILKITILILILIIVFKVLYKHLILPQHIMQYVWYDDYSDAYNAAHTATTIQQLRIAEEKYFAFTNKAVIQGHHHFKNCSNCLFKLLLTKRQQITPKTATV